MKKAFHLFLAKRKRQLVESNQYEMQSRLALSSGMIK